MDRHGLPRKRARQGGSLLFLLVIGAVVAGAGVAGLRYRDQLWDDHGHPDHVATSSPEPTFTLPVTLTSADELAPASTVVVAPEKEEAKPDAGLPPHAPPPKAMPVVARKPPPPKKEEPKTDKDAPSADGDMFAKPD